MLLIEQFVERALGFADEAVILRHGLVGLARPREPRPGASSSPSTSGARPLPRSEGIRTSAAGMRTYVRVRDAGGFWRGEHPPRRPRRLLRVGRAARRPSPARQAGHRRRRSRAVVELRGAGVRGAHRDGRTTGPATVSAGDRGRAPDVGLLRSERGGVRGVRRHHALGRGLVDRRSVPRRRRPAADRRALPPRSPSSCAANVLDARRSADHGGRRPHQIPGQGRERRGQARRAARGAARR